MREYITFLTIKSPQKRNTLLLHSTGMNIILRRYDTLK